MDNKIKIYTLQDAKKDALNILEKCDMAQIKKAKSKADLVALHHGIGRYIRNNLSLWHKKLEGNMHPDDFSMKIIELIWEEIK